MLEETTSCNSEDVFFMYYFSFPALQRRSLQCLMANGTALDSILCNEQTRPTEKRECFNEHCRGTWKVSDWSEVNHHSHLHLNVLNH